MKHIVSFAAALLTAGTLVTAAAHAQAPQGYYVAVPAAASTKASLVTRSAAWRQQNGAFVANQAPERADILCQLVADRTGALASFSANGKAFDTAQLAKCNAKVIAKAGTAAEVASVAK